MPGQKIVVLGTGGTIAGRLRQSSPAGETTADRIAVAQGAYDAARETVDALLQGLRAPAHHKLVAEQVAQVDSKDMALGVWQALVGRLQVWLAQPDVAGVVVTHGTDTLEETAWLLQTLLAPVKPVVLVSAMRPADAPDADGPLNLQDALAVAAHPEACGVVAVAAGRILSALQVQKVHGSRLDAFASATGTDLGKVVSGQVTGLQGAAICWPAPRTGTDGSALAGRVTAFLAARALPRVEIAWSAAGFDAGIWLAQIDAARARQLRLEPLRGLVVAGTGSGTLHHALTGVVQAAVDAGIRVVLTTRCPQGGLADQGSSGVPVIDTLERSALGPFKARVQLMTDLL